MGKLVVLKLGEGDFEQGFPVTLQIGQEGRNPSTEINGRLPPAPDLPQHYSDWQAAYLYQEGRLDPFVPNVSFREECNRAASNLRHNLNEWLKAESFRPLREKWLEQLQVDEELRFILQTQHRQLQRLPWHRCWLFERYRKAEIALSNPNYEPKPKGQSSSSKVRILAILGDSTGIDTEKDRNSLQKLPNAEVTFLEEPQSQQLNDHLWEQSWDILFFAGHSSSPADASGRIYFNSSESLTVAELKHGLQKAIEQGLQLAIFNSCDGLGLAQDLADLSLSQVIVMREPVPDQVAQEFLKYFLSTFADGKSLYLAVKKARERLERMEKNFPCATWLPVIYQNPAVEPLTWPKKQPSLLISPTFSAVVTLVVILVSFLGFFVFTEVTESDSDPPQQPPDEANSWQKFSSAEEGFRFLMPSEPKEEIDNKKVKDKTIYVHQFSLELEEGRKVGYKVMSMSFTNFSNQLSPKHISSFLEGAVGEGELLTEQAVTLDGYDGKEFKFRDAKGLGMIYKGRIYLVKQHVYMLLAVARTEADLSQGADKFFNSFQLPKENADADFSDLPQLKSPYPGDEGEPYKNDGTSNYNENVDIWQRRAWKS